MPNVSKEIKKRLGDKVGEFSGYRLYVRDKDGDSVLERRVREVTNKDDANFNSYLEGAIAYYDNNKPSAPNALEWFILLSDKIVFRVRGKHYAAKVLYSEITGLKDDDDGIILTVRSGNTYKMPCHRIISQDVIGLLAKLAETASKVSNGLQAKLAEMQSKVIKLLKIGLKLLAAALFLWLMWLIISSDSWIATACQYLMALLWLVFDLLFRITKSGNPDAWLKFTIFFWGTMLAMHWLAGK